MTSAIADEHKQPQTRPDRQKPSDALEALYKNVGILAVAAAAAYVTRPQKPLSPRNKPF